MSTTTSHSNANTMSTEIKPKKVVAKKAEDKKVEEKKVEEKKVVSTPAVAEDKKPRGRKAAVKAEAGVVVAESKKDAAPAAEAGVAPTFSSVADRLKEIQSRVSGELKEVIREALAAAKSAAREVKAAGKKRRVKKDVADMTPEEKVIWEARRANNAFLKPRPLSPELCAFLGVPAGSQRSQTEVTKHVSQYVKAHGCFDPSNKRRIIPDGSLSKLLKVTDKDAVTYLNLQSFLKVHFLKTA
jgi:chromatin remodeling complex protein RSC6